MAETAHDARPDPSSPGYEHEDAPMMPVVGAGVVLAAVCLASFVAMAGLHASMRQRAEVPASDHPRRVSRRVTTGHNLQEIPGEHRARSDARGRELIGRYAFVDEARGHVRIPIERAMELVVERGLPHRSSADSPTSTPPPRGPAHHEAGAGGEGS